MEEQKGELLYGREFNSHQPLKFVKQFYNNYQYNLYKPS